MEYDVIARSGEYALINRGTPRREYAVVRGLNDTTGEWDFTCKYKMYNNDVEKVYALNTITEYFLTRISNYIIPKARMWELATLFKDGLMQDDPDEAKIYFDEVCEMTDYEKEFFGIDEEGENK